MLPFEILSPVVYVKFGQHAALGVVVLVDYYLHLAVQHKAFVRFKLQEVGVEDHLVHVLLPSTIPNLAFKASLANREIVLYPYEALFAHDVLLPVA